MRDCYYLVAFAVPPRGSVASWTRKREFLAPSIVPALEALGRKPSERAIGRTSLGDGPRIWICDPGRYRHPVAARRAIELLTPGGSLCRPFCTSYTSRRTVFASPVEDNAGDARSAGWAVRTAAADTVSSTVVIRVRGCFITSPCCDGTDRRWHSPMAPKVSRLAPHPARRAFPSGAYGVRLAALPGRVQRGRPPAQV